MPSFGATGALFSRHFDVLKNLKRRILLLQNAYEQQQDQDRSWDQVKEILKVLSEGCRFLAFDEAAESNDLVNQKTNLTFYEDPNLEVDEKRVKSLMH